MAAVEGTVERVEGVGLGTEVPGALFGAELGQGPEGALPLGARGVDHAVERAEVGLGVGQGAAEVVLVGRVGRQEEDGGSQGFEGGHPPGAGGSPLLGSFVCAPALPLPARNPPPSPLTPSHAASRLRGVSRPTPPFRSLRTWTEVEEDEAGLGLPGEMAGQRVAVPFEASGEEVDASFAERGDVRRAEAGGLEGREPALAAPESDELVGGPGSELGDDTVEEVRLLAGRGRRKRDVHGTADNVRQLLGEDPEETDSVDFSG